MTVATSRCKIRLPVHTSMIFAEDSSGFSTLYTGRKLVREESPMYQENFISKMKTNTSLAKSWAP